MKSIGALYDLMLGGYGCRRNGYRADIDAEDLVLRRHDQSPKIFRLSTIMPLQKISEDKLKRWNLVQSFRCLLYMTKKEVDVKLDGLLVSCNGRSNIHPALGQ